MGKQFRDLPPEEAKKAAQEFLKGMQKQQQNQ